MQFLESSVFGLRSARHRLRRAEGGASVTLYPMVHVGDAAFYEQAYSEAAEHDVVLMEGVRSKVVRNLTAAYRWVDTDALGLVVQPPPDFGSNARCATVRADLTPQEFDALWRRVRWYWRAAARVTYPAMGFWLRLTASRATLARGLCTDDLPSRDDIMMWNRHSAPFLHAILAARDERLCETLIAVLQSQAPAGGSVAVIYGAGHMGAVTRTLGAAGYAPVESRWLTAITA